MDESLDFHGYIAAGIGRHSDLVIPGRAQLESPPDDWPDRLCAGSLNVRVFPDRFPPAFKQHGLRPLIASLDEGRFLPETQIPHERIGNNTFGRERGPRGGDAQVWRALLFRDGKQLAVPPCWVLRRFGSRVAEQLELVSGSRLRGFPGIIDGAVLMVRMFGAWRSPG